MARSSSRIKTTAISQGAGSLETYLIATIVLQALSFKFALLSFIAYKWYLSGRYKIYMWKYERFMRNYKRRTAPQVQGFETSYYDQTPYGGATNISADFVLLTDYPTDYPTDSPADSIISVPPPAHDEDMAPPP